VKKGEYGGRFLYSCITMKPAEIVSRRLGAEETKEKDGGGGPN
jgi:hypothetical protein